MIAHKMDDPQALSPEAIVDFALRALTHPDPFPSAGA